MPRQRTTPTRPCEGCGAQFTAWPCEVKVGRGRFCSKPCVSRVLNASVELIDNGASALIPLYARDRTICGYATVDAADAAWASKWTWRMSSTGYAERGEGSGVAHRKVLLHRELLGLKSADDDVADHIDRDSLNDRRVNLRRIPSAANQQNKSSAHGSTSAYRGVCWTSSKRKWGASIRIRGKLVNLGTFTYEHAAAEVAKLARLRLMPFAVD